LLTLIICDVIMYTTMNIIIQREREREREREKERKEKRKF
jgi:hypothetical protein